MSLETSDPASTRIIDYLPLGAWRLSAWMPVENPTNVDFKLKSFPFSLMDFNYFFYLYYCFFIFSKRFPTNVLISTLAIAPRRASEKQNRRIVSRDPPQPPPSAHSSLARLWLDPGLARFWFSFDPVQVSLFFQTPQRPRPLIISTQDRRTLPHSTFPILKVEHIQSWAVTEGDPWPQTPPDQELINISKAASAAKLCRTNCQATCT